MVSCGIDAGEQIFAVVRHVRLFREKGKRAADRRLRGIEAVLVDIVAEGQNGVEDIGGTLRLGSYPCVLAKDSKAYALYGEETIHERHRHRYEVNNYYRDDLEKNGMKLSGLSPDGRIVEMLEIPEHPWFVATQAHPEFKSRPNHPHPLFKGFVGAALEYQDK